MKLAYSMNGNGPVVVLLHGYLSDSLYWHKVRSKLTKRYTVVSIDLLGFGKSPKPKRVPYSIQIHAKLVADIIADVSEGPVIIVGHSMGALIACQVSRDYPSMVARLILSNMPLYKNAEQARSVIQNTNTLYRLALYSPAAHLIWPIIKIFAPRGKLRLGPTGAFSPHHTYHSRKSSLTHTIEATNALALFGSVPSRTLLICGTYDRSVYKQNLALAQLPNHISIKWVTTGHHTPIYAPEIIVQELL